MANPNELATSWLKRRFFAAVGIGLVGSVLIWVVTPYNDNILGGGFISDSFVPAIAFFLLLVLVLAVNPLARLIAPGWELDSRQLAVVMGILLVASSIPSTGTLRTVMYAIANVPFQTSQNPRLADSAIADRTKTKGHSRKDFTSPTSGGKAISRYLKSR